MVRKLQRIGAVAVFVAACYAAWTFYSRHREVQRSEQQTRERQAQDARKVVDTYGGDKLTILSFAADTGAVKPGGRAVLCYGVNNATQVKIEPDVEPLRPALTHCTEVFPKKTTTYTLTASDSAGRTATAELTVQVR